MIPEQLEARNDQLYNKLVPQSGKCETIEGEMLRAINKIIYRHYNDGDYWYAGYGCETAGPAEAFLRQAAPVDVRAELQASYGTEDEEYENHLAAILEKIVSYVESRTQLTPNHCDMLNFESLYEWEEQEEY